MDKRLLSLLLLLALLLCAASGLGEKTSSLTAAKINALKMLAGDTNTQWKEGARPTPDMNALQMWRWTDWFLSRQVRSLLGTVQDYDLLDTNNSLDPGTEEVQWMLLEMENTLSHFEAQLEDDRLAILNGIELYQSGEASEADRQRAVSRTLEAESEIRQIIRTICEDYGKYLDKVNECSNRLNAQNAESVLNGQYAALIDAAEALEIEENATNADFKISVISKLQFKIQVKDAKGNAISGATVTATNRENTAKTKTLTTNSSGDAIFSMSDMGADEKKQMQLTLRITASGYRIREVKMIKLFGGDATTIYLEKDDGKPYLIMSGFNGCDILTEKNTFYYSPKNDFYHAISAKLSSATDGTLELHYHDENGEKVVSKAFKASDTDKTELVFKDTWLSILQPGTKVYFKIITKDKQDYTFDTQLDIQKAIVDEPFLSESSSLFKFFGGDGGFGFDIPSELPFIGGERLAIAIPGKAPKFMILPTGRAMFSWGATYSSKDVSWKSEDMQDMENAKKEFAAKSTADRLLAKAGAYRGINTSTEPKMLGSFGASVNPFVSVQGMYDSTEHKLVMEGDVGATLTFKAAFTQTFTMGPVPFFAGVDFSMGASFGLKTNVVVNMEFVDGTMSILKAPTITYIAADGSGLTISIRLELGGTIGLGLQDVASVALRGYGYLNPVVNLLGTGVGAEAKYGMGVGVTVRVLFLKWQRTLASVDNKDLKLSNSTMTLSEPSDGEYKQLSNEGADIPQEPRTDIVTNGSNGVEPTETKQVFSQIDSATGGFQYAVIGGDTYLFWIQPLTPSGTNKVGARVWWHNLNDTSKFGQVDWLNQNSVPNGNETAHGSVINRETYADYDFAVEVSRGLNNQASSFCALTILSGKFSGTGSGQTPQAPSESIMTTVLMQRVDNGELQIRFYYEDTSKTYLPGNYPIMPEVFMTAAADDLRSVYVVSTCTSSNYQNEIHALAAYRKDGSSATGLDEVVVLDPLKDGYNITRYHVGIPSSSEDVNVYSLNEAGELSRLYLSGINSRRELLVINEDIVNFRVYSQIDTKNTKDRLFYLKRVKLEDGKYINQLKCATLDLKSPTAFPPVTDFNVEINADQFDIVKFGTGVYLYWTECSTPDPTKTTAKPKYMVRCLRYDPGTDTVCGPFNMVELPESPNTIKLQDSGTGFYSVDLQNSPGSYLRQSFTKFTYKLVSSAELMTATPKDTSVCAGDYIDIVFSAKNTGNVPLSGLNVKIKNGSKEIQTLHIDCANPVENSSTVNSANGTPRVMSGAYTVRRISGMYDALNNDSWEITRTNANGATTVQSVQTAMLMPGDTHYYEAKLLVPTDWSGDKNLTATIGSVEGDIAVNGVLENGVLMLTGADAPQMLNATNDPIMITRLSANEQTFNTDVHDLALSARIFKLNGEDYVRVNIKNLSGNTESAVTPILTSSYRGKTLFTHKFVRSMGDDFGYSMDIPLKRLTQGRSLQDLDLYVGANTDYDEYANSDNHVRLLLITQLCIIEQPVSIPASVGQGAVFSVTLAGGKTPYRYQWQRMIGVDRWEDIPGAKQETYRIASVKEDQNGLIVRCVVTDQFGDSVTSDSATLTILPQTGDSSQLTLLLLLALSSMAVLVMARRKACRR